MKAFQNQEVLVEFDGTSAIVGKVIDANDVGVSIQRTSDNKKYFIQWSRISNFSDV